MIYIYIGIRLYYASTHKPNTQSNAHIRGRLHIQGFMVCRLGSSAARERERERDDWINYLKYYVMCIGIIREYFFSTRTHVCDSARENVKCVARAKK